jgi:hypothetical protein
MWWMRPLPAISPSRVAATFPDAELNGLARSVNSLVETVDRGLGETGSVLAALAEADLTRRVKGDFQGAFAKPSRPTPMPWPKSSARSWAPAARHVGRPQARHRRNPFGRQ